MEREELQYFLQRLQERREQLMHQIKQYEEELHDIQEEMPADSKDAAPWERRQDLLKRFIADDRAELHQIEAALSKIEAGTYGICEECGDPIPIPRLRARPLVLYCLRCQEEMERF